jgi:hypothetical protein
MSSGGSFWDGGVWAPNFGVYSTSTSNQNKRNVGYNNSLNEGGNYSTTLGVNFSTVVGGNYSTTGGMSMSTVVLANTPVTLGGKIELIIPFSVKWTLGLYDYDFKYVTNLIKNVAATNQYTNNVVANDYKGTTGKHTNVVPADQQFISNAQKNIGISIETVASENTKVMNATFTYNAVNTTVGLVDIKRVEGTHQVSAGAHLFSSLAGGKISISKFIIMTGESLFFNGKIINLG